MAGYKKITKAQSEATNFKNRPENINRNGQPPKIMSKILSEIKEAGYERVTANMVIEAYEYLLGMDADMLLLMSLDPQQPILLQIVSRTMLSGQNAVDMLEKVLDRAHGKSLVKQSLQNPDGTPIQIITFTLPDNGRDPT